MFKIGDWVKTAGDMTGEIIETEVGGMYRVKTREGNFWHHQSLLQYLVEKDPEPDEFRYVEIYIDGKPSSNMMVKKGETVSIFVK